VPVGITAWHANGTYDTANGTIAVPQSNGDGVTDALPAIQAALDQANSAGGGHVYVPAGTYLLTTNTASSPGYLQIGSNTRLELHPLATIRRNNNGNGMLRVYGTANDTGPTGYTGFSSITVSGGTWDGNLAAFPQAHNIITSTHCDGFTVRDTTLRNCYGFHFLEFNSTRRGRALNVTCLDFDGTTSAKEMIQIDAALTPNLGGSADGTPCDDILIQGCHLRNGARGIGTHTAALHRNIKVTGCHISDMREEAVRAQDWFGFTVSGNTMRNCQSGIRAISTTQTLRNGTISGNTYDLAPSTGGGRAIDLDGNDTNLRCREVTVTGNTLRGTAANAGQWGIQVRFAQEITITGNQVSGFNQSGIIIFKAKTITVGQNVARGNNTSANATHADLTTTGSTATDLQDVTLTGNMVDTILFGSFGDRILATGNIAATSLTVSGTNAPTNVNRVANFVAGTFVA
jgi:parallel beta-helix repeat protein